MGLFDFMKTAGEETIEDTVQVSAERVDELRQAAIVEHIAKLDVQGEQVAVRVKGDTATLTGTAPSQEALEKIVLCAGNQYGIGQVDCQLTLAGTAPQSGASSAVGAARGPASPDAQADFYTVQPGDTLSKIAKDHYGDGGKYMTIFNANRPMLEDPDKIFPGQTLRIPPV
jgi:nucleoid-associated protein YgaU